MYIKKAEEKKKGITITISSLMNNNKDNIETTLITKSVWRPSWILVMGGKKRMREKERKE